MIAQYEARLLDLHTAISNLRVPHLLAICVFAVALTACAVLSVYILRGQVSFLFIPLPVVLSAASARSLRRIQEAESRHRRLQRYYERALERARGNWIGRGASGEEFDVPNHIYSSDLHLFGAGSLFELLCTARTSSGRQGLADYLLGAPVPEEIALRQEAVRELRGNVELRERIALLGEFQFRESSRAPFDEWLDSPRLIFPRMLPGLPA